MNSQAGGAGADPFSKAADEVRAMAAAPWWRGAAPQQRAEAITSRMLSSGAEWWLFGAWGRWYRCGLDGHWHPCPPPAGPARMAALPAPPGAANPPVPPGMVPTGPDLAAGRAASVGLAGDSPDVAVLARVKQSLITALSVNPAQFPLQDPSFAAGTPSTLAAVWGALLWCAGTPVVLADHPLIELFVPYLTVSRDRLRWMVTPGLSQLCAYYCERLLAGDAVGSSYLARVMAEVAAALQEDPGFQPGADALAAIAGRSVQLVRNDMATARYGPGALAQEWQRRCPVEHAIPIVREAAPGEYLRLALYDLTEAVAELTAGHSSPAASPAELRRTAVAVLAADLQTAPQAVSAAVPWLDPDSARTLQEVLAQPSHPLRTVWPREGRLPDRLRSADPGRLRDLLATSYAIALTWCRLARMNPPVPGFVVPAAVAAELTSPAVQSPQSTAQLTPRQIIDAARAHLAASRDSELNAGPPAAAPPSPPAPPAPAGPLAQHAAAESVPWPPPAPPGTPDAGPQPAAFPPQAAAPPMPAHRPLPAQLTEGFLDAFADPLATRAAAADADGDLAAAAPPMPVQPPPQPDPFSAPPAVPALPATAGAAGRAAAAAEELEPAAHGIDDLAGYRAELQALAGLAPVKEAMERMLAEARVAAARRSAGLPVAQATRHLAFAGNPGTGKSTVAGLLGRLYAAIGLLDSGHLVECTPAELAGPGGPVAAVRARTGQALGGVLLIDRAAALGEPRATAVLAELARAMDERRDQFVVVCADRPAQLRHLVGAVPALGRRLGEVVDFPDPADEDLTAIFRSCAERRQYVLDDAMQAVLPERLRTLRSAPDFAAGHSVRKLFEDTLARQALRIVRDGRTLSADQLIHLTAEDLPA